MQLATELRSDDVKITNIGGSTPEAMAFVADIADKLTAVSLGISPNEVIKAAENGNLTDLIEQAQFSTLATDQAKIINIGASSPEAMAFVTELAEELTAVSIGFTPEEVLAAAKTKKLTKLINDDRLFTLTADRLKIPGIGADSPGAMGFVADIAGKLTAVSLGYSAKEVVAAAEAGKLSEMIEAVQSPTLSPDKTKIHGVGTVSNDPQAMKFVNQLANELTAVSFGHSPETVVSAAKEGKLDALVNDVRLTKKQLASHNTPPDGQDPSSRGTSPKKGPTSGHAR